MTTPSGPLRFGPVTYTVRDAVAHLDLGDGDDGNVLHEARVAGCEAAMQAAVTAGLKVGLLRANGAYFCAGAGLKQPGQQPAGARLIAALDASPLLWVAAVQGDVVGPALQLLSCCPLVVAADHATFLLPRLPEGRFATPVSAALAQVIGPRPALRMALSNEPMAADRARDLGLVDLVVPAQRLAAAAAHEAAALAARHPQTLELARNAWQTRLGIRPGGGE